MAGDVVRLMTHLGHDRFAVAGHDRGALVAFRTAMDHPELVSHLIVMDGLPVIEHLERVDAAFALAYWHWWFLAQSEKPAERVICADPEAWYRIGDPAALGEGNHADLRTAVHDPAVVHGMCEDYRDSGHHQAEQAPAAGSRGAAGLSVPRRTRREFDGPSSTAMITSKCLRIRRTRSVRAGIRG